MLLEFKMPLVEQTAWINPDQVCAVVTNEQMSGRSSKTGCVILMSGGHKLSLVESATDVSARIGAARSGAEAGT
jgi:hypothetical protein